MKRETITIKKYTFKFCLDNKYFYINNEKKLFNLLNKRKHIKILDLQNLKKRMILIKQFGERYSLKMIFNNLRYKKPKSFK